MKKLIAACITCLLVSACGWHLRGSIGADLNIDSVYVAAEDSHGSLVTDLRRALTSNQVTVTNDSSMAQYQILLSNERSERRVVSVGNQALAAEYELTLSAIYRIEDSNGTVLAPASDVFAVRSYNFDPNAVVAIAEEEKLIERELRVNLVQQIIRRLQFVSQKSPAPATVNSSNGQAAP